MINFFDLRNSISGLFWYIILMPFFQKIGKKSRIVKPLKIKGLNKIIIGENVIINALSWLQVEHVDGLLKIEDGTIIGHFNHIYAFKKIHIGKNVLTADKVYISDCMHTYNDINFPVMNQEVISLNEIKIGDHSWLGENVVIIGASVGKHCIIGSNSVVTNDIPDYSVAVGAPARVIKRYDFDNKKWVKISG
jgi:acetyltransferase-like isoleucine patch superfamily enzyme